MKPLLLLVTTLVFSAPSFARDSEYAVITTANKINRAGERCSGGNITAITGVQKLPDANNGARSFNLYRLEPGEYIVHFNFSRFREIDGGCFETETGRVGENEGKDTGQAKVSAEAGKVYKLGLADDLSAQVTTLAEMHIDDLVIAGIVQTVVGMQRQRDDCQNLFRNRRARFSDQYQKSKVSLYAKRFGLERQTIEPRANDRAKFRRRFGLTKSQANEWCNIEFAEKLADFDYLYGDRLDDVQKFLEQYRPPQ